MTLETERHFLDALTDIQEELDNRIEELECDINEKQAELEKLRDIKYELDKADF